MYNVEICDLKWGKNHDDSVLGHRHYHLLKILERRWISRVTSRLIVCQFGQRLALNETSGFSKDKEFFMSDDQLMIYISSRENYFCTIKVIHIKIKIKSIMTMSSQPQGSYLKVLFFKCHLNSTRLIGVNLFYSLPVFLLL